MKRRNFINVIGSGIVSGIISTPVFSCNNNSGLDSSASAELPFTKYRCLFNHELNIALYQGISREALANYVERLAGTDVDAVMCCPTAWRTNLFPSSVDPGWKNYTQDPIKKYPELVKYLKYIYDGGDPVGETLAVCKSQKRGFFISYRMNDWHHVDDKNWPTHNAFFREHPEYWLLDTDKFATGGDSEVRLFNWMLPAVRDHYFTILEELVTRYDVDGIELDFNRCWILFHRQEIEAGIPVLTGFMRRLRDLLDRVGKERGKYLQFCIRSLDTVKHCRNYGMDVVAWANENLIDMINVSSSYIQTTEIGIEEFKKQAPECRVYGEMNFITNKYPFRYTLVENYRAAALNFFSRKVDGVSLFNFDYVPSKELRTALAPALVGLANIPRLQTQSKAYGIYMNEGFISTSLPAINAVTFPLIVGDDTRKNAFTKALIRVETKTIFPAGTFSLLFNGKALLSCDCPNQTELFPLPESVVKSFSQEWLSRDFLHFFEVPVELILYGSNEVELKKLDSVAGTLTFNTLELALYK